jgi:hypothetical protein
MQIDCIDEQQENACDSIRVSFETDSKVIDESNLHDSKHRLQRVSTEAGMQIDRNDEQSENAFASIRVSFEPDSKINDEID